MTPTSSERRRSREGRRRTVRIVAQQSVYRTATISLLVASLAAILLFAAWRVWRQDRPTVAPQRTLRDVQLRWKCEGGHYFYESGQSEPRACPRCGRPAYPVETFECDKHGPFEVAVRFTKGPDGRAHVSELRLESGVGGKGEWVFAEDGLRCPRCGAILHRQELDPLRNFPGRSGKDRSTP